MPNQPGSTERQGGAYNVVSHFILLPLFLFCTLSAIVGVVQSLGHFELWRVVLALACLGGFLLTAQQRIYSLRVQDRVIRLEERLRIAALLAPEEAAGVYSLSMRQLIALRFASDEEIPALVRRTLEQNLTSQQIKDAIRVWRRDDIRI